VLLVRLLDETAAFLPAGTLEAFRADLGLTYTQAGTVLAAVAPGALLGGVCAAAADRRSRRVIAAGGAFAFAAALAAFALGGSLPVLVVAAFVMGVASTAMVEAAEVALVEMAGDDLRRYLARSNLLGTIGDLAGPALIGAVALAGFSWRAVFALGAVLLAAYGALLAAAPLRPPGGGADGAEPPSTVGTVLAVVRDPAVWVLGLVLALMLPFDEPLFGFMIALLEQERGASASVAMLVALVGVCGGLLSYTVLARRFEGVDDRRLLVGSVLAMGAAAVVIAVVPVLAVAALGAFVASVGLSLAWLAVQHRTLTLRPGQVGTTNAVVGTIESAGFWIPVAIGALADRAGLVAAVAAFGLLGLVLAALARLQVMGMRRGRSEAGLGTRTVSTPSSMDATTPSSSTSPGSTTS
jgi:predicted MFS family arabinose efflux permease